MRRMRKRPAGGKKISIGSYITVGTIFLILLTASVMFFVIYYLSGSAEKAYIRSSLSREVRRNNWDTSYENGEIQVGENFQTVNDMEMHFLILDRVGNVFAGYYPEEIPEEEIPGAILRGKFLITEEVLTLELGEKEYYLLDRIHAYLTRKTGRTILSRCIVEKDSIPNPFRNLWGIMGVSIPLILLIACVFCYVIARMVSRPIGRLCQVAENIRIKNDLSQRMDYNGRFREIAILSDANNRMLDELEKVFQSQQRFNSDVAHELRTPMAVILAKCESVMEQDCDEEKYRDAIDVVYRQAQRTNDIVLQLLRISRLDENKVLEKEYVNLEDIIRSVCEDEELKTQGEADFQFAFQDVSANVDVTLMVVLLQNLIHNAVKYSDGKALVEIATRRGEGNIFITVRDHGRGISEEDQKHIFELFYQVDKSRGSEGFGLGLSIAEKIARLHGGRIEVASEPGKGSRFTLIIPEKDE